MLAGSPAMNSWLTLSLYRSLFSALAALLLAAAACASPGDELWEQDLGPLESTLDEPARRLWPGHEQPEGGRVIPLINGFGNGAPIGYWFVGQAPSTTADMFWFCREDDALCPLDEQGRLNLDRSVGRPVFARMPGEQSYSTYWWIKVIRVPAGYEADSIKSVHGIERAIQAQRVSHEWYHFNYGGSVGPKRAIEHSVLVLDGTRLQGNGDDLIAEPGVASQTVPLLEGWHKQYRVHFYDFTGIEGVLTPDSEEGMPLMVPTADMYMIFRDCTTAVQPAVCDAATDMRGGVNERGLDQDLTADSDRLDTNNILAPRPEGFSPAASSYRGWGLWAVKTVTVSAEQNDTLELIDTTADQFRSAVKSTIVLDDLVVAKHVSEPTPLQPNRVGKPPGSGEVLFDCPVQVAAAGP